MRSVYILSILSILPLAAYADFSSFSTGPAIEDCGPVADVDVTADDLLPGVKMALSAMAAHTLLQQQGYTLIAF